MSLLFGLCFLGIVWAEIGNQPQSGPILFWQNGAIYTIDPDGTNLKRITRALLADRRFIEVSAGCHGLVDAPCWVLIGHVLYHVSGKGAPLPLLKDQSWVNAPASWSPDGVHLAYPVADKTTSTRQLLIYDTFSEFVWLATEDIDDSVKPAWSPGCRKTIHQNCYLAYAKKADAGQRGLKIAVMGFQDEQIQEWIVPSGFGSTLKWSDDDRLYYGRLNWYYVEEGTRVAAAIEDTLTLSLSPSANYAVYVSYTSSSSQTCRDCNFYGLWLAQTSTERREPIYLAPSLASDRRFNYEVFWSPGEDAFATFTAGKLIYYDLKENKTSIWFETQTADILSSYAFSPTGDGLAFVGGIFLDNPEKPENRLFVVDKSGLVKTLIGRSSDPILLLAWLAERPDDHYPPREFGAFVQQFKADK